MGTLRMRVRRRRRDEAPVSAPTAATQAATFVAGNQSLSRLAAYHGTGRGGAAAPTLEPEDPQRVALPPVVAEPTTDTSVVGSLLERVLAGHGNGPSPTPGVPVPYPSTGAAASGDGVSIAVNFTANEPRVIRKPGADIAADHDQEDAMGWTTPAYSVTGRAGSTATSGTLDVTMDFTMELAEEYAGRTLDVLRDHETGHVNLAAAAGELILADMLESGLESLPALTRSTADPIVAGAGNLFEFTEGTLSWLYDRVDYPRMRAAYLGARMTLEELIDVSPAVEPMVDALRELAAVGDEAGDVIAAAKQLQRTRSGLSDLDLARVQYNQEFEQLVFDADDAIARLLTEFEEGSEPERRLRELMRTLGDFSWEAPGSG
jgi:hypothetical protein